MGKKILSLLTALVLLIVTVPAFSVTVAGVTSAVKTQDEAVAWLRAQDGASYDFSNFYDSDGNYWHGTQCVEFVRAYVNWLVNGDPWADAWGGATGNGDTIWQNALWDRLGWAVYYNDVDFLPQPGDIFSSGGVHTGVVISSDLINATVADSNAKTSDPHDGDPVWVHDIKWKLATSNTAYGATHYIRPVFKTAVAQASFPPRTSAPDSANKYYIKTTHGGYNECIVIDDSTGSCLPNCVGYAWGRAYEAFGERPNLSRGNAWTWYNYNINGGYYQYGSAPEAGAIACWSNAAGDYGHVAFVESVSGDSVTITESNYGGTRWATKTMTADAMKTYSGYTLQGYIYVGRNASSTVHEDLGDDFFAFIIQKSDWKHIEAYGMNVQIASGGNNAKDSKQVWHFIRMSDGSYKIINKYSGKCLDAAEFGTADGTNVQVVVSNDSAAQRWFIIACGDGFRIVPSYSNSLTLDCTAGLTTAGTNIQLYTYNGSNAQIFTIYNTDLDGGDQSDAGISNLGIAGRLNKLREKFPDGKFWNHYTNSYHNHEGPYNSCTNLNCMNPDGYTDSPCATHSGPAGEGCYDCNYFDGGIQCFGFANKIFFDVFGVYASQMEKRYDTENVTVGDWIRVDNDNHSAVVLARNGNDLVIVEGNYSQNCMIKWDRTISLSTVNYYKHATNWDEINSIGEQQTEISVVWQSSPKETIGSGNTNTVLAKKAYVSGTSVMNIAQCGIRLYSAYGVPLAEKTENANPDNSYDYLQIWYDLQDELKLTLSPATTYYYEFFIIISGKTFTSELYEFTTGENQAVNVTGLSVKTRPKKTTYYVGESFNTSGLSLDVTYSDGSKATVDSGYSVSGFSSETAGTKMVTVTYKGVTASFSITVINMTAEKTIVTHAGSVFTVDVKVPSKRVGQNGIGLSVTYDKELFRFVSGEWKIENAQLANFNVNDVLLGVVATEEKGDIDGIVCTLTFSVAENAGNADSLIRASLTFSPSDETVNVTPALVKIKDYVPGDLNGDDSVTADDAIYLLYHVFFASTYPVSQPVDFNGDGSVTADDAIYLLYHVFFADAYPI